MATVYVPRGAARRAAAAPLGDSLILGERPDRVTPNRFNAARRSVQRLEEDGADAQLGTAVFRLSPAPEATLTSLSAELEAAPAATVYLDGGALPEALQRRVPLALLQRRADRYGKRLVLLTADRDLRRLARAAGIDVQAAVAGAAGAPDRPSGPARFPFALPRAAALRTFWPEKAGGVLRLPQPGRPGALSAMPRPKALAGLAGGRVLSLPGARVASPLAAALAVLWLLWTVVPTASVRLVAAPEPWSTTLALQVDPELKKPDVAGGRLPGRAVSRELAETAQTPATGRRVVPDAAASGQVVFINKSDKQVTVPRGTVVLAGNVRFQTRADVAVAATVAAGLQQRVGMGRVDVVAAGGGPAGNVERFQINKIEGPLATALDVQNDAPTRGGTERQVPFVTADDRRRLQESLQASLSDKLLQQVRSQLPAPDKETVVPWSGQNPQVVEAVFSKAADEEAPAVALTLKLRYGATVFGNDAYNAAVRQLTAGRLAETKPGFEVVPDTVRPEPPELNGVESSGVVRLTGLASATVRPRLDGGDLRGALSGRSAGDARAYLAGLPGVVDAEVTTWPGWLGRMPSLGARIGVTVVAPPPGAAAAGGRPAPAGAVAQPTPAWRSAPNGP